METSRNAQKQGGRIFGFPVRGFSLFQGMLLSVASALITFCITTMLAIFGLLIWNLGGHHSVDFADSYRLIGFPAGLLVLIIALPIFFTVWLRGKFGK